MKRSPLLKPVGVKMIASRFPTSKTEKLLSIRQSLNKTLQIKDMADKLFEYFLVYSSEWESTQLELADAGQVLQQFWGEYAFSLESKGFTVQTNFCPLAGSLRINLDLLRRAFDNLYSNLLKYADPAQPVELAYDREGDWVYLTLVNHISPRRDRRESTNIGLNTCRRVLQYHGGTFQTEEADGMFRAVVALPLIDAGI